jgi:hypothetical protein
MERLDGASANSGQIVTTGAFPARPQPCIVGHAFIDGFRYQLPTPTNYVGQHCPPTFLRQDQNRAIRP